MWGYTPALFSKDVDTIAVRANVGTVHIVLSLHYLEIIMSVTKIIGLLILIVGTPLLIGPYVVQGDPLPLAAIVMAIAVFPSLSNGIKVWALLIIPISTAVAVGVYTVQSDYTPLAAVLIALAGMAIFSFGASPQPQSSK